MIGFVRMCIVELLLKGSLAYSVWDMESVADETEKLLAGAGVAFAAVDRVYEFDMLYLGQTHTVSVPVTIAASGLTGDAIREAFEAAYKDAYGRLLEGIPMRVMNYRIAVIGRRPQLDMAVFAPTSGKPEQDCRIGKRSVFCDGAWHEAIVYERLDLEVGAEITGPALLEQSDTTIFVDPGLRGRVDAFGNLVIDRRNGADV